jgi:DNA-binding transcriptional LysR family regulator
MEVGHAFEQDACAKRPGLAAETVVRGDGWGNAWPGLGGESHRLRAASWDQAQHLAAVGLGVALLPQHVAVLPGLVARPVPEAGDMRAVVLAAVNGRMYSSLLDGFLNLNRAKEFTVALAA